MRLSLVRQKSSPNSTLGSLYIDGKWYCFTLEDIVRPLGPNGEGKIAGRTAIPTGEYAVIIDKSVRFNRLMPHILDVPFFTGVRIHAGNGPSDTDGCPLLGMTKVNNDAIGQSKIAFDAFFERLKFALTEGPVTLTITEDEMEHFKICLPTFLAVITTLMVIGIMCVLAFVDISPERVNLMNNVAITVVTQWVGVMGYFFGSSQSSAKKTDLLNPTPNGPTAGKVITDTHTEEESK